MSDLLEVTGDDIAQLSDSELRELIGLLCEADYRSAGLSTHGIKWSGHQDAKDGGLDVIIEGERQLPETSFVPRANIGFQVKKSCMPASQISNEMKPKSKKGEPTPKAILRDSIKNLIDKKGAYIIVSSGDSTTEPALETRLKAMRKAVAEEKHHEDLLLDFLDRGRVASWVRLHPSMILWVRNKVGRPLTGWQSYDNWADAPDGIKEEYIFDEGMRLHDGTSSTNDNLTIQEGLDRLRAVLVGRGVSARLIGLSGVGKTRLVQALFDEQIGNHALNHFQAYYTDLSDSPDPEPVSFVRLLLAEQNPALLIVDNCPPDLHRRLTEIVTGSQSLVSLLTVEYDVRDDLPEETHVFKLEPASQKVLEQLIQRRFQHISPVDVYTIAELAGGNARLAIALARTVNPNETISGLRDRELFKRLFWQRNKPDDELMLTASVCSLIYSFDGESTESDASELSFLASLVDKSASKIYRDVVSLKQRDLIQSRSVWRAVLPPAIANRLAKDALEFIPKNQLIDAFLNRGSERLVKSFSRRLSYLHDDAIAIEIATEWLDTDGWIGSAIHNLGGLGISVFRNLAPVVPEKTLALLEHAAMGDNFVSKENYRYEDIKRILWHLAYDPRLFTRSTRLLCRFAISEMRLTNDRPVLGYLNRLFYSKHSGTHALPSVRADIIGELVESDDQHTQKLGLILLGNALQTSGFDNSLEFEFGARPRDYGYEPKTKDEVYQWYKIFIDLCIELTISSKPIAGQAKQLLSNHFRDLWLYEITQDILEESAQRVHSEVGWIEGWFAVRGAIRFVDKRKPRNGSLEKLYRLEEVLKPVTLIERTRAYAILPHSHGYIFDETLKKSSQEYRDDLEKTVQDIGSEVASNSKVFTLLLPEMFTTLNILLGCLGYGLFNGSDDKRQLWQNLCDQFKQTPADKRNKHVLLGYLSACAVSDPDLYNTLLDEILDDSVLGQEFPHYQTTAPINQRGLERLRKALDNEIVNVASYRNLIQVHQGASISDDQLAELVRHIVSKENGFHTGFNLLQNKFHHGKSRAYSAKLIDTARNVLLKYPFEDEHGRDDDYALPQILEACLCGVENTGFADSFGKKLKKSFDARQINITPNHSLFESFAKECPTIFLNLFVDDDKERDDHLARMSPSNFHPVASIIHKIPDSTVLAWCEIEPETRYPVIIRFIGTHHSTKEKAGVMAWNPIVYAIFKSAPDLEPILEELGELARVNSYSGSRADTMEVRSTLFHALTSHENEEIRRWAKGHYQELHESIPREREKEKEWHREQNQRFE